MQGKENNLIIYFGIRIVKACILWYIRKKHIYFIRYILLQHIPSCLYIKQKKALFKESAIDLSFLFAALV